MEENGVLDRIDKLLPAIRVRREEAEQARCMPRDLVEELRRTGIFSLGVPRAIGGLEATPVELMRAIEKVAAADGSIGWCAMVAIANNLAAGYMNERGAREVFADPTAPSAGLAAPAGAALPVDGGFRVSGRWAFASGINHSTWLSAGCLVMENGQPRMTSEGPEIVHVCMPVTEGAILDTWHVSGLRGTGSNDFTAQNVFVPLQRTFSLLNPSGHRRESLYQMPPMALFVFQLASVSLGIARAALDELIALAQTKVPSMYQAVLAERPAAQLDVARAETALGAARALLFEKADELWQVARASQPPTLRQIALARAAASHAVETAAEVTRTMSTLAGGGTIYATSSLQRQARDAEAITHRFTVAGHTWEDAGRVLLGRVPVAAAF